MTDAVLQTASVYFGLLPPHRPFHKGDFFRRQLVELVHQLVNFPPQRRRVRLGVVSLGGHDAVNERADRDLLFKRQVRNRELFDVIVNPEGNTHSTCRSDLI